ncbi:dihydrofolate reductase family protein [Shimia abyssi]|uniref:Dihydrofolate reductase n=1 Tax=Shimia abyssi TaxID=1662395 RepID=A0A2P8F955_9RHOB|nr:dihydrofolate reductase family protein [Shimia abyssi]PSL18202.1 dihydrofolate reductase [Shimia abyssi]
MHPIIYDVAVSLDDYICDPGGDVSQFTHDGEVVEDYQQRLAGYASAIMGRATYEIGYAHGMQPGQNPYPHMSTFVFSDSLKVPENCEISVLARAAQDEVLRLKAQGDGPIYLCGGGVFAGALLRDRLIDRVIFKRAPVVLGGGVPVFSGISEPVRLKRISSRGYDNGYVLETFET